VVLVRLHCRRRSHAQPRLALDFFRPLEGLALSRFRHGRKDLLRKFGLRRLGGSVSESNRPVYHRQTHRI
jgi:hypothetical protein